MGRVPKKVYFWKFRRFPKHVNILIRFTAHRWSGAWSIVCASADHVECLGSKMDPPMHRQKLLFQLISTLPNQQKWVKYPGSKHPTCIFSQWDILEKPRGKSVSDHWDWPLRMTCRCFRKSFRKSSQWVDIPKTIIAPENAPSQKETSLPTIHFEVLYY